MPCKGFANCGRKTWLQRGASDSWLAAGTGGGWQGAGLAEKGAGPHGILPRLADGQQHAGWNPIGA